MRQGDLIHPEQQRENANQRDVESGHSQMRRRYRLKGYYANVYFTQREAETALLAMEGRTMKQIAATLCLSPRTVEFYINRIKEKLLCRSKSELISVLHRIHFSLYREQILMHQGEREQ